MDPHPLWHALEQHLLKSIPEYTALLGLFLVAVIANMPHPDVIEKLLGESRFAQWVAVGYRWFYDSLQAFMAARNPRTPSTQVVTTAPAVVAVNPPKES